MTTIEAIGTIAAVVVLIATAVFIYIVARTF